ncbi:DNA recombination and repair protein-like, ATP-binding domain containing protein [Trema orientale]|uniref:DNA recombination and repair protein-like, ATP-binding domain containing protein n=1 Tax=Trema orientale TaxID=63057 RepID=A0A2P5EFL4_TREOI|nr:DNA recombination and repair protein-like, ATP-binding domain containing protein [Trema orientale]
MEVRRRWIDGDESAGEMLARLSTERPFLLLPPLHRLPLRVGNVVELVGPSPSAKTLILIQAAISCILPKEWNGVHYGGLGRLVVFIDLDCRFDILCLSKMLKHRILEANGLLVETTMEQDDADKQACDKRSHPYVDYVEELHALCMRRFLYVRCYDSFEFLATLKTLHYQLKQVEAIQQSSVYLLMIDSIGAFHWVERASTFSQSRNSNRKSLSLQSMSETVVQDMKKLLLVHPMLVIATKAISIGDRYSAKEVQRKKSFPDCPDSRNITSSTHKLPYREYMPSVWQVMFYEKLFAAYIS